MGSVSYILFIIIRWDIGQTMTSYHSADYILFPMGPYEEA